MIQSYLAFDDAFRHRKLHYILYKNYNCQDNSITNKEKLLLLIGKKWTFRHCIGLLAKLQTMLVYNWNKNSVFCIQLRCVRENYFIVNKLKGQIKESCKGRCTPVELFQFQRNKVNNFTGICSVLGILPYRKGVWLLRLTYPCNNEVISIGHSWAPNFLISSSKMKDL